MAKAIKKAPPVELTEAEIENQRFADLNATGEKDGEAQEEAQEEEGLKKFSADFMKPFVESYPLEKKFHITSDGQVFLDANKHDAIAHQKTIDASVEVSVHHA